MARNIPLTSDDVQMTSGEQEGKLHMSKMSKPGDVRLNSMTW